MARTTVCVRLIKIANELDTMSTNAEIHGDIGKADKLQKLAEASEEVNSYILGCEVK